MKKNLQDLMVRHVSPWELVHLSRRDDCVKEDISRLVVVSYADSDGKPGRVYEKWDVHIKQSVQDDGRTLKIFVRDREEKKGPL